MNNQQLLKKAAESLGAAVQLDKEGQYELAYAKYRFGIESLIVVARFEKIEEQKTKLLKKIENYLSRAELLKQKLSGGNQPPQPLAEGEKKQDNKGGIQNAIVRDKPNVKWTDVAGLEAAKEALMEAVLLPMRQPQFFNNRRKPWKGILLYGPPGTGKSFLAKAVATEVNSTFFAISSADIMSKFLGESEALVRKLFVTAREESPAVVFVDEIDSLCSARDESSGNDALARVKTEFMIQMDGVGTESTGLLVLGATNLPWALDEAMRRRFQKRIYIALPTEAARQQIFRMNLGPDGESFSSAQFVQLAKDSDGYSGSDLSSVVLDALMMPVRDIATVKFFRKLDDGNFEPIFEYPPCPRCPMQLSTTVDKANANTYPTCESCGAMRMSLYNAPVGKVTEPKVNFQHVVESLKNVKPTVAQADLERHVKWTATYGQDG